jgi:hypothetical protein
VGTDRRLPLMNEQDLQHLLGLAATEVPWPEHPIRQGHLQRTQQTGRHATAHHDTSLNARHGRGRATVRRREFSMPVAPALPLEQAAQAQRTSEDDRVRGKLTLTSSICQAPVRHSPHG